MEEIVNTRPKPFVFVLRPFASEFDDIYQLGIKVACDKAGTYAERVDEQIFQGSILERVYNQISKADIIEILPGAFLKLEWGLQFSGKRRLEAHLCPLAVRLYFESMFPEEYPFTIHVELEPVTDDFLIESESAIADRPKSAR